MGRPKSRKKIVLLSFIIISAIVGGSLLLVFLPSEPSTIKAPYNDMWSDNRSHASISLRGDDICDQYFDNQSTTGSSWDSA